jgi:hypothetical protein
MRTVRFYQHELATVSVPTRVTAEKELILIKANPAFKL